jgi:tryptophanyl-tRNA synthetase
MAADILIFNADAVPVGKDQIQHVEIARDIAIKFNNQYGEIFALPNAVIDDNVATVPGIDGAKMSKSYGNTIDIFDDEKSLKKRVNKIVTDSTPVEEPKNPDTCNIIAIAKLFMSEVELAELRARYAKGGEGYGVYKKELGERIWDYFAHYRARREALLTNPKEVLEILKYGAEKAKNKSAQTIEKIREVVGILR